MNELDGSVDDTPLNGCPKNPMMVPEVLLGLSSPIDDVLIRQTDDDYSVEFLVGFLFIEDICS